MRLLKFAPKASLEHVIMNTDFEKTGKRKVSAGNYRYKVVREKFIMPDGVSLDSTIYMPVRKRKDEQFPVLLEILPYRKDDTFFIMDYPAYSYFAQHGFITVKVDIRGTGGSCGVLPDREYSDIELDDAEEVIKQLARHPKSNGNVGMFGVSWSGFNSIQVASRRPKALKAILAMHASDDLYHDDLHYIDGVLHLDPYHLYINHENGLPQTPDYKLDSKYFENRFDQKPWLFRYLSQQTDGDFWARKSLSSNYPSLITPTYLIGGLMDGYRDTVIRMLENSCAPIKAEIGAWDHSCPDGDIGPQHEWQDEAIRWFEHYLKGYDNGIDQEVQTPRKLAVYVRDGHAPEPDVKDIPGKWRYETWPIKRTNWLSLFPSGGRKLLRSPSTSTDTATLHYLPSVGTSAGTWWGDTTGDMTADDGRSLTFDTPCLKEKTEIVGIPKVKLKVSTKSARANWSVRLEDVHPDGRVSLVTGALLNGRHFTGRAKPSDLVPGKQYEVELDLHFTTWTFKPGHKIRLAVGNAQFPIAWPSPFKMTTRLELGTASTCLLIPVIPEAESDSPVFARVVEGKPETTDGDYLEIAGGKPEFKKYVTQDLLNGETSIHYETNSAYKIKRREFRVEGKNKWTIHDKNPCCASYEGWMSTSIKSAARQIRVTTKITVTSSKSEFLVTVVRTLARNGKTYRTKKWTEKIKRVNS